MSARFCLGGSGLQDFAESFIAEYAPFLFREYAYVIENGSEGNFPHIHMVFQCNPKTKKQLNAWLAKIATARLNMVRGTTSWRCLWGCLNLGSFTFD